MFTPLHRALGEPEGPITSEMLNEAIEQGIEEMRDLDYKAKVPSARSIKDSDYPKDIAAMSNSGGGMLIFGITDKQGKPGQRCELGVDIDEKWTRAFRQMAMTKIQPPVYGIEFVDVKGDESCPDALVVIIPNSNARPHLLNVERDTFGVPVRVGDNTAWLGESEIARLYRERFTFQERTREALGDFYGGLSALRSNSAPWIVGVAVPRETPIRKKVSNANAFNTMNRARIVTEGFHGHVKQGGYSALSGVHRAARRGYRCWTYKGASLSDDGFGLVSLHDTGAVQLLCEVPELTDVGGSREYWIGQLEVEVANLVSLAIAQSADTGITQFDFQIGVEWSSEDFVNFGHSHNAWHVSEDSVPLKHFTSVFASFDVSFQDADSLVLVRELAEDCVNQFGVEHLRLIRKPEQQ